MSISRFLKKYDWAKRTFYSILSLLVGSAVVAWWGAMDLPIWTIVLTVIPIIGAVLIEQVSPKTLANIYVKRDLVTYLIIAVAILYSFILYTYIPLELSELGWYSITQFLVQGTLVGVVLRTLLLHFFNAIIRGQRTYQSRFLLLISYFVILLLLPLGHRQYIVFYFQGMLFGYLVHYFSRFSRRGVNPRIRFLKLIERPEFIKSQPEPLRKALEHFTYQEWNKLKKLIGENEGKESFEFIKFSMYFWNKQHGHALNKIKAIIDNNRKVSHFYYLHYALNLRESFTTFEELKNDKEVEKYLNMALLSNPDCMLSNAVLGHHLALFNRPESLDYILKALDIYEDNDPNVLSVITGLAIPATYTFFLNSYALALLKNDKTRKARELLYLCQLHDPNNPFSYVHIGELYFILCQHNNSPYSKKYPNWRNIIRTSLHVGMILDSHQTKSADNSFITNYSKNLLNLVK